MSCADAAASGSRGRSANGASFTRAPNLTVARRRPDSDYQPCPKCGNPDPERVHFTFWGSFHITNLVSHVQCPACGSLIPAASTRCDVCGWTAPGK